VGKSECAAKLQEMKKGVEKMSAAVAEMAKMLPPPPK
jgi:hypothetical protein